MTTPAVTTDTDTAPRGSTTEQAPPLTPAGPEAHPRRWAILAVTSLALLVVSLDNTILNVALPSVGRELSATSAQLQWFVDAYILVFAALLLIGGNIGDRYGRRRALLLGLTVFGVASIGAAFAGGSDALITWRGVMGLGGALIMPATLSIITAVFPADERGKAIGAWAAVSGLGVAGGPLAGGWLLEHFWWGSVFLINAPVVLIAVAATWMLIPETRDPEAGPLDMVGAVLSVLALGALVYGIIAAPEHGWTDPLTTAALLAGVVTLVAFVVWELRQPAPMLQLRLFRDRRFSAASIAVTLVNFALVGLIFFLTQYMQLVLGYGTLQTGVRVIPVAVAIVVFAQVGVATAARFGPRVAVAAGMAVTTASLVTFSLVEVDSGYPLIATTLVLLGIGLSMAGTPATESIMSALPVDKAGVGSAMNDTTREVGGALGVAVLGSLMSAFYSGRMTQHLDALPTTSADIAADSVTGALAIADALPAPAADALNLAALEAFTSAAADASLVGAGFSVAGMVVAALYLPGRTSRSDAPQ